MGRDIISSSNSFVYYLKIKNIVLTYFFLFFNFLEPFSYLDYFIYRQSIYGIFQKIISINIMLSLNEMKTIFAILSKDNVAGFINFYEWSEDTNQLIIDESIYKTLINF